MWEFLVRGALIAAPALTILSTAWRAEEPPRVPWFEDQYIAREAPLPVVWMGRVTEAEDPPEVVIVAVEALPEPPPVVAAQPIAPAMLSRPPAASVDLVPAMERAGWPPELHGALLWIIQCESGGNAAALGDQGRAYGLMQIRADMHPGLAARYNLWDPVGNLMAARELFLASGSFAPWSCAR